MGHIVSREVLSRPDAALHVEVLHLDEEAEANLTSGATGLTRRKGERPAWLYILGRLYLNLLAICGAWTLLGAIGDHGYALLLSVAMAICFAWALDNTRPQ